MQTTLIEGPCCQRARLPVDQVGVANAKVNANSTEYEWGRNNRPIRNVIMGVNATKNEATITYTN